MSGFGDEEEEYKGTVRVVLPHEGDEKGEPVTVEVRAHLAGHFSPLTGDYRWKGRLRRPRPHTRRARGRRATRCPQPVGRTPDPWDGHSPLRRPPRRTRPLTTVEDP